MSRRDPERSRALAFLAGMCVLLAAAAIASLVSPSSSTPGVTVTAIILLAGSAYGLVACAVASVRGARRGDAAEAAERDSASE